METNEKLALMFLFWTHVGAVILLLGFLTIGFSVGSFDFADIQESEIPSDVVQLIGSSDYHRAWCKTCSFSCSIFGYLMLTVLHQLQLVLSYHLQ